MRLHHDAKRDLVARLPLFADCTPAELDEVVAVADEYDFSPGRALTREGSMGQEFVVVIDGTAEVQRDGIVVASIGPGEWFGEMALVEHVPRNATVVARSPLHVLVVEGHRFVQLLEHAPDIREKVTRVVAERHH